MEAHSLIPIAPQDHGGIELMTRLIFDQMGNRWKLDEQQNHLRDVDVRMSHDAIQLFNSVRH